MKSYKLNVLITKTANSITIIVAPVMLWNTAKYQMFERCRSHRSFKLTIHPTLSVYQRDPSRIYVLCKIIYLLRHFCEFLKYMIYVNIRFFMHQRYLLINSSLHINNTHTYDAL
jgi:hypothetical protein